MKRLGIISAIVLIFAAALLADDPSSAIKFVVLKDYSGKPVRNASVVLHQVDKLGRQAKGGLQLKTDAEGQASFDGVPYGKLRVQVLLTGFQTFGEDYDISQPQTEITIRLKRPADQYSIYDEKHPSSESKPEDKKPNQNNSKEAKPGEDKPSGDKPNDDKQPPQ